MEAKGQNAVWPLAHEFHRIMKIAVSGITVENKPKNSLNTGITYLDKCCEDSDD